MAVTTLTKVKENVRVELRRNPNDYIGGERFYYAYFFSKAGCFGSAKVTKNEIHPIRIPNRTKNEEQNFYSALEVMQEDIKVLAGLLNESGEDKGDLETEVDGQLVVRKRGRPSIDEKPLLRTTVLLTQEDKDKLKLLGGATWIRNQIRIARMPTE